MSSFTTTIRQCLRPNCRFRFPISTASDAGDLCPKCGSPTRVVELPHAGLTLQESRSVAPEPRIEILLDNLRSAMNVGSIFRTADGASVDHIHLCGITPTPDHPKVAKTALGAEISVPWTQHWDSHALLEEKKAAGYRIWALESGEQSHSIFDLTSQVSTQPLLLILGSEVSGVDPGLLKECEYLVRLPMLGVKGSLNVSVAFGIAVYILRFVPSLSTP